MQKAAPIPMSDSSLDDRGPRATALRRYISLLRKEERRLDLMRLAPSANRLDAATCEVGMRTAAEKIATAEKELRHVEDRAMKRQASVKDHKPL
jgi:hypothetical protein